MRLIASATMGLESVVKNECLDLDFKNIEAFNGRVEFDGDFEDVVKANIHLRCADRVFIKMREFKALTYEELFQNIKKINWQDFIEEDGVFPISWVSSVKSKLYSKSDIQKISKKAIVEKLKETYKKELFLESGALFAIKIQCHNNNFIVMLDTSGEGLHKRGYRKNQKAAPIKETMAAALVKLSRWRAEEVLLDPMCGTGTIAIEAAMIGKNIAAGANRTFASEKWKVIPENLWTDIRDEAFSSELEDKEIKIYASDIDEEVIEIAKENAEICGVEDCIIFENKDFKDIEHIAKYGLMITNPPYGERLMNSSFDKIDKEENISENREVEELYRELGEMCRKKLAKWSYYIITSYENFEKVFKLKSSKNRKLYNGGLKCYFYQYYGAGRNGYSSGRKN
ncbi:MAG: class I SAM-dependent RNA methyltransferase [Fusobacterium sp.]|nr:class I SAM-dependent RNA methyltransferase [Fusobacterium sp.]